MTNTKPKGSVRKVAGDTVSPKARGLVAPGSLQEMTGSTDTDRAMVLLQETLLSLWSPKELSEEQLDQRQKAALAALKAIAPTDEFERMLAAQMVAAHSAAMDCFRRAMLEGATFDGRELNLKHAEKPMATYTRQMEALDKYGRKSGFCRKRWAPSPHLRPNSAGAASRAR
jgi:hypothetical protein